MTILQNFVKHLSTHSEMPYLHINKTSARNENISYKF